MTTVNDRRLWPGTVPPAGGSPDRLPGSVRRTTSIDLVRPEGLRGPLVITGRGRDLATGTGGASTVVGEASTEVTVDYLGDRTVTGVRSTPVDPGLQVLVGASAGSGFRRQLAERCPELVRSGSILHQLLDDVTPGTLISGSALARQGFVRFDAEARARLPVDICAGWQDGGAMLDAVAETGVPLLGWGPAAPALEEPGDAVGWHRMEDLPPMSLRRRRRTDLVPGEQGSIHVDARFRDSYWEDDGTETVVHEYGVAATFDPATWELSAIAVVPGPLPAPECPMAVPSAQRLVGVAAPRFRDEVRTSFTGTSTCTHLNDVLRSLADAPILWAVRR